MQNLNTDTIAAIATAKGTGGIGVIRISGAKALEILRSMLRRGGKELATFTPRRMEHGWILDAKGNSLDEVLAVFMPGPHTFSGEDVAEIHCHGGMAVLEAALESILTRGARLADAGEFTRRAYLNGRLDLSQSEAVAEMIAAPTLQGVYLARNKLEGRLGTALTELRQKLDWLRARLYLALDFPDDAEEEDSNASAEFQNMVNEIVTAIKELIASYERAKLWREGASVVLAGQVNAGKSSLLNAMLGRKRALVSDTPGTTRDFIEESINLNGLPVRLIDTAGLRTANDSIEAEGIEIAQELLKEADIIMLVLDSTKLPPAALQHLCTCADTNTACTNTANLAALENILNPEDAEILRNYSERVFIALNKSDLNPELCHMHAAGNTGTTANSTKPGSSNSCSPASASNTGGAAPSTSIPTLFGCPCAAVSAKTGTGLSSLSNGLYNTLLAHAGSINFAEAAPPTLRQKTQLTMVLAELNELSQEYQNQIPAELLSARLDSAAGFLAEVIGVSSTEEVLDTVFSKFCIGK